MKETQELFLNGIDAENSASDDDEEKNSPMQSDAKKVAGKNARDFYYAGSSFNGLRDSPLVGDFFRSHVGWFATDLNVLLTVGTS